MRSPLSLKDFYRFADAVHGRTIVDAYAIRLPRSREFQSAHLVLDRGRCRIEVDINTDEILVLFDKRDGGSSNLGVARTRLDRDCLAHIVGKQLGWLWACYNSQGYRDALMFSICGVVPDAIFYAIASDLRIGRVLVKTDEKRGSR